MIQAVIMAGGKGTRLLSITKDEIPKPMAAVCGKPILEWQLDCLRRQGISDVVIIVGHLGHKIREHFGDGSAFQMHIQYVEETTPLGTAGAFPLLPPLLTGEQFLLVFGDVLFDIDLARMLAFHREKQAKATLFVHPNTHPFDSDLVVADEDDRVIRFDSKHNIRDYWYDNCVNAGLYLFDSGVCGLVAEPVKTDLEKQLLSGMIARGKGVYAYRSPEYIKDVGTVERIRAAELELASGYIAARALRYRQKAIFLDRDGTINKKNGLIFREDQFELEDCAAEAIRHINASGYLAIVITNQPVVARGLCTVEAVETIHNKMKTLLGREGVFLDAVCFCPHHPDKGYPEENPVYKIPCHCRKPAVGMLEDCAVRYNIDLSQSWVIGDSTVDIQTGKNAGMKTALVLTGDAGRDGKYDATPDLTASDLLAAVEKIVNAGKQEG